MIPKKLRDRLLAFIAEHEGLLPQCETECVFQQAEEWVDEMETRGFPRKELLLMALAYQAYLGREVNAQRKERERDFVPPVANRSPLKLV